ncbi:MAG: hypothetical protein ACI92B_002868, partial [Marinobacter maritimus]
YILSHYGRQQKGCNPVATLFLQVAGNFFHFSFLTRRQSALRLPSQFQLEKWWVSSHNL